MKKYQVTVNGTAYEVEIELVSDDGKTVAAAPSAPAAPAAPATPAPAAPSAAPAEGNTVTSPMPGTILEINVAVGKAVKSGDVLMVLEAMKMENEIMAPCDGTVTAISVTKGASVNSGAALCTIG